MTDASTARPVLSGRYELHRRIARGGMADVFLARDQLLDRPVAIKVLFPQYAAEPTFVARFRREAQAAANLNHPSVVAVYDWGSHEDTYFIVMEYVEGRSLADTLASEGYLHPDRAADIATDVAAALGFAHRNGTVHRDVKPGNIMITPAGQVKVADFGIARAFGGSDDELTQTGSVMGTATYFSPEQAQGRPVDPRSDLYSLGVVLFEMVTGEPPFSGVSPVAIAYKHVQEQPPMASSLNPSVPRALDAIIARLLAKAPEQRYPAAEEVRADLRRFREGSPLAGRGGPNGFDNASHASHPVGPATQAFSPGALGLGGADPTMAMNGAAPTTAMARPPVSPARRPDTGARAVIDTTRAVPASAAVHQVEPVEEYYEPPSRTGVFLIMLAGLLVLLIGLVVYIVNAFAPGTGTEEEPATEMVAVPTVTGEEQAAATNRLTDEGFLVDIELEEAEEPPGTVIRQDPEGQTEVEPGSTVVLFVSKDEELFTVPDVVGKPKDEAVAELDEAGFEYRINREPSDEFEVDVVVSQSEDPGEQTNSGTVITIVLSTGPEQLEIPDLSGKEQLEANTTLNDMGFTNFRFQSEASSEVEFGRVIRSEPESGSQVARDAAVVVIVSSGAGSQQVPSLIGLAQSAAESQLTTAGFKPVVEFQDTSDPTKVDKVVAQQPEGGLNAQLGSEVRIWIGRLNNNGGGGGNGGSSTTVQPGDGDGD